ncbi:MAG: hypothetical protein IAG10_04335 [Planctomycetaceae bacterium]|nr:hypothetical protein [Planctomycetaceae bacterium]
MSRRMSSSRWLRLWIVWSLLFAGTLQADPPQSEPAPPQPADKTAAPIQFNTIVWDVDHAALRALTKSELGVHEFYKTNGLVKRPDWISATIGDAVGELLSPPGRKAAAPGPLPLRAVAVRNKPVEMTLLGQDISSAMKRISEPTVRTINGQEATIFSGGEVPIFVPRTGDPEVAGWHEFGLKLKIRPHLLDDRRIALVLDFENSELNGPGTDGDDSSVRLISSQGFRLSAKMKLGEQLLVAQQTGKQDVTRLVQLQPVLHTDEAVAEKPSDQPKILPHPPAWPATNGTIAPKSTAQPNVPSDQFVVEDRWPLGEIKVGQQVVSLPARIEKNSVSFDVGFGMYFLEDKPKASRVIRIEPLPHSPGRRVTLTKPPFDADKRGDEKLAAILDSLQSATTTFVVPHSEVTMTEVLEQRLIRAAYDHIPRERRPQPIEVSVGDTFMLFGVDGLGEPANGHRSERGSFSLEHIDDGYFRATAIKPGITRLLQIFPTILSSEFGTTRLTEYLVKADTRELELHIREQFPTAQVTITSVGTNSLLLRGTVGSDEDSRGIAELAEQFTPNILNRLKVGATDDGASALEPRRMGTPARPIQPASAEEPQGTGKSAHPPKTVKTPQKSNDLRELRDEIRELRQEVRVLIQRLDRQKDSAGAGRGASGAGRGSPDPALDTTAGLPKLDKATKKTDDANGDLRSNPAAGSGDPRRAPALDIKSLVAVPVGVTDADRAAAAKLDAKVVWEMVDLPLSKAVQLLATDADINIVFDKLGLEEAGVDPETRISVTVKGVKLRSALKIVLEPLKLGHVFDGEVLKITSRERAEGSPVVVPYPVADLLGKGDVWDELRRLSELIMVTVRGEKEWLGGNTSTPKIHCDGATKSLVVRHTRSMHAELATFLELLRQTKRTTESTNGRSPPPASDEERRIADQLRTKITLNFENVPLKEVLSHLAKDRDLNIVLDSAGLEDESLKPTVPVSISLAQVQTSTALRLLLEPLQLDYVVKNEVVQVTSRQRAAGELVVATYPVGNLLWRKDQHGQPDEQSDLSDLCDLVMSMVEPNSWENVGGPATVRGNLPTRSLVIRQTRTNHARIRELLETLGKLGTETPKTTSQRERGGRRWEDIANRRGKYALPDEGEEAPLIATYSVADLVVSVQPVHLRFRVEDNKAEAVPPAEPVAVANSSAQLRELITSTIAPDSWEEVGGIGQMEFNDSTLSFVVRQIPAVHDELRALLDQLRKLQDQQVSLELRVIKTDDNFHGFGFDLPFSWTQLKPNEAHSLNPKDADALIAAAQREQRTSLFSLPKLTLMTGQPMTLDVNSGSLPAPLHLSGFVMPLAADGHRFTRLHLSARGTHEHTAAHHLTTVRDGHSLLLNVTDSYPVSTQTGVPILDKIPHVDRLFKNVTKSALKPGESLFLLATPRVIIAEEEETTPASPLQNAID